MNGLAPRAWSVFFVGVENDPDEQRDRSHVNKYESCAPGYWLSMII